ncbi:putative gnat family acetyltransferase protein [Botrytis fragariae]|uniref:N-alpha-acetyltransferase 40 n=1 Tax=Botrytis fragariae TaxID=1964551 RepID=A0A8H6B448_9HELO|nr:putative gnat family acetyltransferase protein [Botrytis fragariae]KAF5878780.1 putative gnat family acetyltransferase protein [Botrytis fragariae]
MSTSDSIAIACAKSLEDFERDYMPPRSSYALYSTSPKSEDEAVKSYKLGLYKPSTLRREDLTACLELVEMTSGKHYRESKGGWNGRRKRREMELWDLRYLVVREVDLGICEGEGEGEWQDDEDENGGENGEGEENLGDSEEVKEEIIVEERGEGGEGEGGIKGFMSFMPTFEDGIKVVYLYEIHLMDELRGTGLGTHLMSLLTNIARAIPGVEKTMLTCYTANEVALKFYRKLGYEKDEYSPEPKRLKGGKVLESDYVILSKRVERTGGEVEGKEEEEEVGKGKRKRGV